MDDRPSFYFPIYLFYTGIRYTINSFQRFIGIMWRTTIILLISWICYCQCTITWNSPTDGDNISVYEDRHIGGVVVTLNATTTGNTITYSVLDDIPEFHIQNVNELAVKDQLDFEVTSSYSVRLRAHDDTINEEADITINIVVLDVNDEEPHFTSPSSVTIPIDTTIGSVVYTATADDADTIGTLTFSIKAGNENHYFNIDGTTGEITLSTTLNIGNMAEYDLVLEVTDRVFTVEKHITIFLTEVIWRNPLNNNNTTLSEDAVVDSLITTLSADNAFIYTVLQSQSLFLIRNNNELYLVDSLDYETTKTYTLNLRAFASSGRSADITYTIIVKDVNDVALEFPSDADTVDLSRGTDIGTVVYTAQTTDPDTVGSGPTYFITGGNTNDDFSINRTTGEISLENALYSSQTDTYNLVVEATDGVFNASLSLTVTVNDVIWTEPTTGTVDTVPENEIRVMTNLTAETAVTYFIQSVTPDENNFDIENNQLVLTSELDYESTKSYILVLKAQDAGGKSATVTYKVKVIDVNDEEPVFQSGSFLILPGYTPAGTVVYTAETTDKDTVDTTTYSIIGGNPDNTFSIDPISGNISLNRAFSPTTTEALSYSLVLEADDSVHQVTLSLSIQVVTVSWNSPKDGDNITVYEDKNVGDVVVYLYAITTGSMIRFTVLDDTSQFKIQNANELAIKAKLDFEDTGLYRVQLRAFDDSINMKADITINIAVLDVNDEEPQFTSPSSVTIPTDTTMGSVVYTVNAVDADTIGNLVYSIKGGNEDRHFIINAFSGEITLNTALNITNKREYDLILEVSDGVFTVEKQITIYLTDGKNTTSSDKDVIIVGATLGLFSFIVLVYAAIVTFLLKRKLTKKETMLPDKETNTITYENSEYKSDVNEEQESANSADIEKTADDRVNPDKQYTSLDELTKDDDSAYMVIQPQ